MNRRDFLATAAAGALSAGHASGASERPNIILILADDMGYSDAGCYGGEIRTPNLDRLANGGVRFTQSYNTARCCPTRASLLTGLYPHQTGVGHMVDAPRPFPGYTGDLNRECVTIAEVLQSTGYQTMMSGKWHVTPVTDSKHNWPRQRGFDRYYGIIHGAANYFDPVTLTRDNDPCAPEGKNFYFTDAIAANAAAYIESAAKQERPFFLYAAFTAPHWPLHALEADINRYRGRYGKGWDVLRQERRERMVKMGLINGKWPLTTRDERVRTWADTPDKEWQQRRMEVYAAQVDRLDQGIGNIMTALRRTGKERNTLVLFLADNGGCAEEVQPQWKGLHVPSRTHDGRPVRVGNIPSVMPGPEDTYQSYGIPWANLSNSPFRLYKHWVHEGGISSPLIAHWPARISKPLVTHEPAHLIDIMATCVDVSGAKYPAAVQPMEGVSLAGAFTGAKVNRKDALYWEHEGNRAMRDEQWKLVSKHPGNWELYDLEQDRSETQDLAARHPKRVSAMAARYEAWAKRARVEDWDKVTKAPMTPAPIPGTSPAARQRRSSAVS